VIDAGRTVFLWFWALCMALVEIEIEGPRGWALGLPTWFRTRGPAARAYALISPGRPLTGYHLFMVPLPILGLHYPYVSGVDWTLAGEAGTIAVFLAWVIVWDYLWFVLNPHFGVEGFRRGTVWWYPGPWVGRLPLDYFASIAASFAVAALPLAWGAGTDTLVEQAWLVLGLVVLTALAIPLAPLYRRWHAHMRRPDLDDRDEVLRRAEAPDDLTEPG
jgi:hypothetical protein